MKKVFVLLTFLFLLGKINASIPCIVIEWNNDSTSFTVVNYNYNPAALPIVGLTDGLEVLVKREPYIVPEYNSRLKILGTNYSVSEDFDSEYPTNRKWIKEYYFIDRSIEDQIISVTESENYANYQVFPTTKHLKYIALGLAILDKKASGLNISNKEQIILDRINSKALKIWQNHNTAEAKIDTLTGGGLVDLDSDWETIDPEDEE